MAKKEKVSEEQEDNKEILYVVKSLSNEKELPEDVIFQAMEAALASVAAKALCGRGCFDSCGN